MSTEKRVNLKAIAERVGCSTITVSRALRDLPVVRAELKAEILNVAADLGYRPDPALSALAAYRRGTTSVSTSVNIGLLVPEGTLSQRNTHPRTRVFQREIELAAAKLGYAIDIIPLPETPKDQRQIDRILLARGIRGIILPPDVGMLSTGTCIDWSQFSVVQVFGHHSDHIFHAVFRNEHLDMTKIMEEVDARGYHRPAFVMGVSPDTPHFSLKQTIFESALLSKGTADPKELEYLYPNGTDWAGGNFRNWIQQVKTDVLISDSIDYLVTRLRDSGFQIPEKCAFISTSVPHAESICTGMMADQAAHARLAMDMLHGQLLRGERGIPERPVATEIRSFWHKGKTLPRVKLEAGSNE